MVATEGLGGGQSLALTGGAEWHRLYLGGADLMPVLTDGLALDALTAEALLAEDTRPRCTPRDDTGIIILRSVNSNPGSDPEDMVSIRIWVDAGRVVTVQRRACVAVDQIAQALQRDAGPKSPGDFLAFLTDSLTDRMQDIVDEVDTHLERLEEADPARSAAALRREIADLRRRVVTLRRYIAPQRDALDVMVAEPFAWMSEIQVRRIGEVVDRVTRLVEQLDEIHLRASIAQETLSGLVMERLTRAMLTLSVVAGLFLPLGFVTGLFGMNVGGIPGREAGWAFAAIALGLVVAGLVALWLLRRNRLF